MTAPNELERRLTDYYATEAPRRAPDWVLASTLATIDTTPQRRQMFRMPWSVPPTKSTARLAIAALVLLALVVAGLLVVGSAPPEPVPNPLTWTPERYAEDWPSPPRSEPPSGAPDVLLVRGANTHWDPAEHAWEGLEHADPVGDVGADAGPWIDIRRVGGPGAGIAAYSIDLAGGTPLPVTDPAGRWIAYGIVVDTNGDGIADERIGIDNMPDGAHRAWSTDLGTGRTMWKAGPGYGVVYDNGVRGGGYVGLDTWYPSAREETDGAFLRYSGGSGRYYGWASMIEDGRVVATDFAPDVGWLVQPEDPGLPLVGTTWTIAREFPSRSLTVEMWLVFTSDGHLQLELCQRGDATVEVTQDTMRVRDIALTGDPCSAEVTEMEAEILSVLSEDELSYTVDAGILELRVGSDVLRFDGSPDPPPGF